MRSPLGFTRTFFGALVLITCLGTTGCATLQQLGAVRNLDFALTDVGDVSLAGVNLSRIRSFSDLSFSDVAALTMAYQRKDLPFSIALDVEAANAPSNPEARILEMEWMLFLEDQETVSGRTTDEVLVPAGGSTVFPVVANMNLTDFFDGGIQDLVEIALSFSGMGGEPKEVSLSAVPVVQTVFGPMSYPEPIRIFRVDAGVP